MDFTYIRQALDMLSERRIDGHGVERTVLEPDWTEPDPVHSERQRAFRAVPERDGRVLRMVYELADTGVQVITVSWTAAGAGYDED